MTEVVKFKWLALNLLPEERELAHAFNGTLVKDIAKNDLEVHLLKIVENTYLTRGWTYDGAMGAIQAHECVKDIKQYFGTLTIEEIAIAFAKGVRNEYGEYIGLNVATYFIWLRTYMTSSVRTEAKKKQLAYKMEQEKPKELSEKEKDAILKQGALDAFEKYKKDGTYADLGNPVYNWLDKKGKIPFPIERKKEFMLIAEKNLEVQLQASKDVAADIYERRKIEQQLIHLVNEKDKIICEAKRIALCIFFKELIEFDQDIKDML